jgi:uncharacterized protein YbjT (DUF2867 family)
MMILVTGGSGYVGSHIVRRLHTMGKPVRAMVYNPRRAETEGRLKGLNIQIVPGDVTRPATLKPVLEGCSSIIHTVAIAVEKGNLTYERINFQGTVNLVEAAQNSGVRRFINLSQLGADPSLPYRFLASKGKAQAHVATSKLDWTAFRPSVIWGPEDEFANTFARLVPLSPLIFPIVGGKDAKFQPVWVEDVAACVVESIDDYATLRKEYELGGPEILTLEEIERRTLKALGVQRALIRFPMPLLRFAVTLMEILLPSPPVTRSLLELVSVRNVTTFNSIHRFVPNPRPFTAKNAATYMRSFRLRDTLRQFFSA